VPVDVRSKFKVVNATWNQCVTRLASTAKD
jgi:hypothetical protein